MVGIEATFTSKRNHQLSVKSNPGFHLFYFTFLWGWSRKVSQLIRCKSKTNHILVGRVFSRFLLLSFEVSLFLLRVLIGIFLSFDWLLYLRWLGFMAFIKKWMKMIELEENSGDARAGRDLDFFIIPLPWIFSTHLCPKW